MSAIHYSSCALTLGRNWCTCGDVAERIWRRQGRIPVRALSDKHWLLFDGDRNVTGCHCGFEADVEADAGYGDSVVEHLLDVGGAA